MSNETKEMGYQEGIEHFFNDLKYVTVSLVKDRNLLLDKFESSIFDIPYDEIKERYSNEYELFYYSVDQGLHKSSKQMTVRESMQILSSYKERLTHLAGSLSGILKERSGLCESFGVKAFDSFKDMHVFINAVQGIARDLSVTYSWFDLKNEEKMRGYIDEVQTKIEDSLKARKRILKVWKDEVLSDENYQMIESFVAAKQGNLKFLNSSFWKNRKKLKALFKEEAELLTDQEIDVLHHNIQLLKHDESWLVRHQDEISSIIGNAYQEEKTDFEGLRLSYQKFQEFLNFFNNKEIPEKLIDKFISEEAGIPYFCDIVSKLSFYYPEEIFREFTYIYPNVEEQNFYITPVEQLYDYCIQTLEVISHLETDYSLFMQKARLHVADTMLLGEVRTALYQVERVDQKEKWLKENQETITKICAGRYQNNDTDWDALKKYLLEQKEDQNKTAELAEKVKSITYSYEFYQICKADIKEYKEEGGEEEDTDSMLSYIIQKEQPIALKSLLRRAAAFLALPRVTPKLKAKVETYLRDSLSDEYIVRNEYVMAADPSKIKFRIPNAREEKRSVDELCEEELKAGILRVIEVHQEITLDAIGKVIASELHYPRRSKSFNDTIERAVQQLKRENQIIRHSGGWRMIADA